MNLKLAMYKGPASGWRNNLGHWAVCVLTMSRYSHVELVIDGACYSASFRDGGVRRKVVGDLETSGHWDIFEVANSGGEGVKQRALQRFAVDEDKPYDWPGMLRVSPLLQWLPRRDQARFCSEMVAWMLGATDPETFSPEDVLEAFADLIPGATR